MTLELDPVIRAYFEAANAGNAEAFGQIFAGNAAVLDEGRERVGLAAIREWEEQTRSLYKPTVQPLRAETLGDRYVVWGLVSGDFPGSPVELRFAFRLENALVTRLEITLPIT